MMERFHQFYYCETVYSTASKISLVHCEYHHIMESWMFSCGFGVV